MQSTHLGGNLCSSLHLFFGLPLSLFPGTVPLLTISVIDSFFFSTFFFQASLLLLISPLFLLALAALWWLHFSHDLLSSLLLSCLALSSPLLKLPTSQYHSASKILPHKSVSGTIIVLYKHLRTFTPFPVLQNLTFIAPTALNAAPILFSSLPSSLTPHSKRRPNMPAPSHLPISGPQSPHYNPPASC